MSRWLFSTDARDIGMFDFFMQLLLLILGINMSMAMRLQLMDINQSAVLHLPNQVYSILTTEKAILIIFFLVLPGILLVFSLLSDELKRLLLFYLKKINRIIYLSLLLGIIFNLLVGIFLGAIIFCDDGINPPSNRFLNFFNKTLGFISTSFSSCISFFNCWPSNSTPGINTTIIGPTDLNLQNMDPDLVPKRSYTHYDGESESDYNSRVARREYAYQNKN